MGAVSTFSSVPVIDVSGLLRGGPDDRRRVADELGRAARDVGFLYVVGTGMDPGLYDDLLDAAQSFFALPLEEKMKVHIAGSTNHRGYVPVGEEVLGGGTDDGKEAFDLGLDLPADDPDYLAGVPMLGPNRWPDLPGFAPAVQAYYDAVFELGRDLFRGFALALGEDAGFFDPLITKPPSQLRLIHYPRDPTASASLGLGAHTDYECFTLLRSTGPGLEVMNGAGEWIDVPPRPEAFVLNIGDMLEVWSGGRFVATTHRVRRVTEERWSFPLFFSVDYDTRVEPLPRFVSSDAAPAPPVIAGEHLFAQTVQTFAYLQRRLTTGDVRLPEGARAVASFGQQARNAANHVAGPR